jgi:hypothetical protein
VGAYNSQKAYLFRLAYDGFFTFSFLEYFTKEDAEFAVSSLDGKLLGGNAVRVSNYHDVSTPFLSSRTFA